MNTSDPNTIANSIIVDGIRFTVGNLSLQIEDIATGGSPLRLAVSAFEASRLIVLLQKLVPEGYGVRSDFRIPIDDDIGLLTTITIEGEVYRGVAKSLSMSGMFVSLDAGHVVASAGTKLAVDLQIENDAAQFMAVVTRGQRDGLGLAFTDLVDGSVSLERLSRLVMAVQRKWIAIKDS